jgi:hypothetical protein
MGSVWEAKRKVYGKYVRSEKGSEKGSMCEMGMRKYYNKIFVIITL